MPTAFLTGLKTRVTAAYNYYKMPIWITEFNANRNRSRAVQDAFLQLALPWLESTPYVERYAYFQPIGGNGDFLDASGNLTSTGLIYLNHISTPSIKEEDYNKYGNNIESRLSIPTSVENPLAIESELNLISIRPAGLCWLKNRIIQVNPSCLTCRVFN